MRIAEYILSAIVAFAIVYVIYDDNQKELPIEQSNSSNNYTISFSTVPTALSDSALTLSVKISGPPDSTIKYWFRFTDITQSDSTKFYQYKKSPLILMNPDSGLFQAKLVTGPRGNLLRYYFEVRDRIGRALVELKSEDGGPLKTIVVGRVDGWIFYGYFLTMFLAIFAVTKASIGSISVAGGKGIVPGTKKFFIVGLIFSFVSALLLKSWYGFQLDADTWQAVPFGERLGDNLQQILMIYLILMIVLSRRAKHTGSTNVIGYLGIFSFVLMAAAYLLPLVLTSESLPVGVGSYVAIAIILLAIIIETRASKNV